MHLLKRKEKLNQDRDLHCLTFKGQIQRDLCMALSGVVQLLVHTRMCVFPEFDITLDTLVPQPQISSQHATEQEKTPLPQRSIMTMNKIVRR